MKKSALFCLCIMPVVMTLASCVWPQTPVMSRTGDDEGKSAWTTVIYMAADNDLDGAAMEDFRELESAESSAGHQVLILLDRSGCGDTRLYELRHNESETAVPGPCASVELSCPALGIIAGGSNEVNMASPAVLSCLLDFAAASYPAEQYNLIMWGHGTGFRFRSSGNRAVAIDDTSGTIMSLPQLAQALSGRKLAVLGFDTCFGTTLEQLYELQDCALFIVGSPGLTPAAGWNYTTMLELWPASGTDGRDAADSMVLAADDASVTAVDTSGISTLVQLFDSFSRTQAGRITDEESRQQVLDQMLGETVVYTVGLYPADLYLDVYSLAVMGDDTRLLEAVENCCIASSDGWPGISVFFTTVSGYNVSVVQHPASYTRGSGDAGQCRFVRDVAGWCPSWNHRDYSLLDVLFYDAVR